MGYHPTRIVTPFFDRVEVCGDVVDHLAPATAELCAVHAGRGMESIDFKNSTFNLKFYIKPISDCDCNYKTLCCPCCPRKKKYNYKKIIK